MSLCGVYTVFLSVCLCGYFGGAFGTMDCSLFQDLTETYVRCSVYAYDSFTGLWETRFIYCGNGYNCCTGQTELSNGCCYAGYIGDSFLYSKGEIAGLVLNLTALATVIILALVIFGATFCNDREDESHLFTTKKK